MTPATDREERSSPSFAFLIEPPPRKIPEEETWKYASRQPRHMLNAAMAVCGAFWLLFLGIGLAREAPLDEVVLLASLMTALLSLAIGLPIGLQAWSQIGQVKRVLVDGELVPCQVRFGQARTRSGRSVPTLEATTGHSPRAICRWHPIPPQLGALGVGDRVDVLIPSPPSAGDVAILVTGNGLWVGDVERSPATGDRQRRNVVGLLLVGAVSVPLVGLGLLCLFGVVFVTFALCIPGSESPFHGRPLLGLFSLALLGVLSAFLLSVAWKLVVYLLGGKEARYLIHPVVQIVLLGALGLTSVVALVVGLFQKTGTLGALVGAVLGLGLTWYRVRTFGKRRMQSQGT